MTIYSYDDMVNLAENSGFSGNSASTMAAIAEAESSGNADAINWNDPGGSFGLTQINGAAQGENYAMNALDPQTSFDEAYSVSQGGTNFTPWSTYNSGAYNSFLPANQNAPVSTSVQNNSFFDNLFGTGSNLTSNPGTDAIVGGGLSQMGGLGGSPSAATNAQSTINSIANSSVGSFFSFITSGAGWERIAIVVIGLILLGIAGFMFATKGFQGTVTTVARNV